MEPQSTYTEACLVDALREGSEAALKELMGNYYPVLFRFTSGIVGDSAAAEDIACGAFLQLWNHRASFTSLPAMRKFLWVTARYDCMDALRREKTQHRHLQTIARHTLENLEMTTLNDIIRAELLADIYAAIRTLPEKMQRVFTMSYIDGMKNEEIAAELKLSPQTVRNQKSRALDLLRLQFGDKENLEGLVLLLLLLGK